MEVCTSSEKMSAKAVAYWKESCQNSAHTAMEQYSDKVIWIPTGTGWPKTENYVNELHTLRCSDTLLGKLSRMEICAQPNNCYEFPLLCLTVPK